jgi:hypothetical protein
MVQVIDDSRLFLAKVLPIQALVTAFPFQYLSQRPLTMPLSTLYAKVDYPL